MMHESQTTAAPEAFLQAIWTGLDGDHRLPARVEFTGQGDLASAFAVTDMAAASIAAAALAMAEHVGAGAAFPPSLRVDRRLAAYWFAASLAPEGWTVPPAWDPVAGDYPAADGWIRLHTNAPHHRAAALAVLSTAGERDAVGCAIGRWQATALEDAIVARGGCAATMRSLEAWSSHAQGQAIQAEPLAWWETTGAAPPADRPLDRARPLAGIRVLDLTRVLAGPVATRLLAGFGADVLRIDPPGWDEPAVAPEVTLGKRCARLDLRDPAGRQHLLALLARADVIVHGYRPGALDRLGLDVGCRSQVRPGLVDVSLDAYGWTGPWAARRGFDSLVQMSAGIAAEGMRHFAKDRPTPLPVQALDHATGYIMAAAAVRGLTLRRLRHQGCTVRVSLARTAGLLTALQPKACAEPFSPLTPEDFDGRREATAWGPARRLRPPLAVAGSPLRWDRPAGELGAETMAEACRAWGIPA